MCVLLGLLHFKPQEQHTGRMGTGRLLVLTTRYGPHPVYICILGLHLGHTLSTIFNDYSAKQDLVEARQSKLSPNLPENRAYCQNRLNAFLCTEVLLRWLTCTASQCITLTKKWSYWFCEHTIHINFNLFVGMYAVICMAQSSPQQYMVLEL